MCMSGSASFSTMVLSSSVSAPWISSSMDLPSSSETSRTIRRKRLKVSPIWTMRRLRALSRISSTSLLTVRVASSSPGVPCGAGGRMQGLGVGRGAGDHQLAHQIDQAVQLVGRDLHHLELLGVVVPGTSSASPGAAATTGGGTAFSWMTMVPSNAPLHGAALHGFPLLEPEGVLQLVAGQAASGQQDLPQEPVLLRQVLDQADVVLHLGMGRDQADLAVLPHELEHVLEGGAVGAGVQLDLQAHAAVLGIEGLPLREGAEQGGQVHDLAQGGQVAHERERVHAVAQDVPAEPDGEVPAVAAGAVRLGRPGRHGRGRRRLGQAAGQVGRQPLEDGVAAGPGLRGLGQVGLQVGDEPGQVVVATPSMRPTRPPSSSRAWLRARSRTLSTRCEKRTMGSSPNSPAEPLMVCTARNMAFTASPPSARSSRVSRASSMEASSSRDSMM